jgi:hypothetical protein
MLGVGDAAASEAAAGVAAASGSARGMLHTVLRNCLVRAASRVGSVPLLLASAIDESGVVVAAVAACAAADATAVAAAR